MMGRRAFKYDPLKDSDQFLHPTFNSTYEDKDVGNGNVSVDSFVDSNQLSAVINNIEYYSHSSVTLKMLTVI